MYYKLLLISTSTSTITCETSTITRETSTITRETSTITCETSTITRETRTITHETHTITRETSTTKMNCFRYQKFMSPLNATICTTTYLEGQKCYGPGKKILFKKQLFDLEVKGQGPTKVITVRDTPPYGHAPTYQISLTYLERQKCYGPDKENTI